MPFRRLERWAAQPPEPGAHKVTGPDAVRRALIRASRTLPGSTCLAQALVAQRLLGRGGVTAVLRIGVAAGNRALGVREIEAHAWLEADGVVVTGAEEMARYAMLTAFDRAR